MSESSGLTDIYIIRLLQAKIRISVDIDILITFKNGGKNKSNLSNNGDKEEEPIQPTQMNIF